MKTVFCFKFVDESGGTIDWYDTEKERDAAFAACSATDKSVFSLSVPEDAHDDEITHMADSVALENTCR